MNTNTDTNDIYYQKYLKYKQKYLELKEKIGGDSEYASSTTKGSSNKYYVCTLNNTKCNEDEEPSIYCEGNLKGHTHKGKEFFACKFCSFNITVIDGEKKTKNKLCGKSPHRVIEKNGTFECKFCSENFAAKKMAKGICVKSQHLLELKDYRCNICDVTLCKKKNN